MSGEGKDPSVANISQLAAMFGMGRATVRSSIEKYCLRPAKVIKGTNHYKIAEVAQTLYGATSIKGKEGGIDPDLLGPSELKDYWMAQQKEMDFKIKIREYLSAHEVRKDYKQLQDSLKEKIQSFPDILERDEGVQPEDIERIITLCDRLMKSLHTVWDD